MLNNKILYALCILLICSSLFLSCNTNKNTSETSNIDKHALSIQLEESLSGKYISNTYSEYNPTDISPSNKTLNQYVANFNCSSSAFSKMKTLMEADTKVEIIQNTNTSDRQSSKSVKSAKTKSIRENN